MPEETDNEAQSIAVLETTQKQPRPFIYLGLLPVSLFLFLVIGLWLFPPSLVIFEPHYLLLAFNTTLFLATSIIAFIAWRSYLLSGSSTVLWLGCGVLTLGTGALVAGWLIAPFGPNVSVTVFNMGVFLAALCHTGGVLASVEERTGKSDPKHRPKRAALAYLAALAVIALLVALTLTDVMPSFFIQGRGPTSIRQYVVEWSLVLLIFASLVMMQRFYPRRSPFLYWYSLALMMVAISMLAFFLQPAVGSPIGWAGRSSYVFAAIYFLVSVRTALGEARARRVGLDEALAQLFGPGLYWQEILATVNDGVVSYDEKGRILLWNKAAERLSGYPEAAVKGKGIDLILLSMKAKDVSGPDGRISETELARQDGSRFDAEVSVSTKGSSLGVITTLVIRDVTERKQAEQKIKRLASFPQLNPNPVLEIDFAGNITYQNEAALKAQGKFGPAMGLEAFFPQDLAEIQAESRKTGESTYYREVRIGETIFAENLHFIPALNVVRIYATDNTERKQTLESLRLSEERLRLAQEAAQVGLWEWKPKEPIMAWTPVLEGLYGLQPGTLHTYQDWTRLVYPEDLPRNEAARDEAVAQHRPFEQEFRILHSSGETRWIQSRGGAFYDEDGNPSRVFGINIDITKSKLLEQALKESQEDLNRAQTVAQTGSWRMDVQRNELTWSDETYRIFQIPPGTPMTYETFLGTVHFEDREYVDREWTAALKGKPYDIEHRILVGGEVKWVDEKAELEFDERGQLLGGFGTVQDITERKRAEKALSESEERYRTLFDNLNEAMSINELQYDDQGNPTDWRILNVNPAYVHASRRSRDDIVGRSLTEIYGIDHAPEPFLSRFAQVVQTGEPVQVEDYCEPLRTHVIISAFHLGGSLFGSLITDISERKQAEEALCHAHDELLLSEIRYRSLVDLIHPDDRPKSPEHIEKIRSGGKLAHWKRESCGWMAG